MDINSQSPSSTATRTWYRHHLYPFHHIEVDDYWVGVHTSWRAMLAELIGSLMYVFISSGVAIASNTFSYPATDPSFVNSLLLIALGNGLSYTVLVFSLYNLSGGHINPATTWGAMVARRMGFLRGIAYMIAQVVGSILGALLITAATPVEYHGRIGAHFWEESLSSFSGCLLQAVLTFFLVFVVFATYYDPVGLGNLAPLPIGLTVTFGYLIGWVFVGPPMNPARALATAIVYGTYDHMWVYWVGPFAGATIAALLYTLLFISRPVAAVDMVKTSAYPNPVFLAPTETTHLIPGPGSGSV